MFSLVKKALPLLCLLSTLCQTLSGQEASGKRWEGSVGFNAGSSFDSGNTSGKYTFSTGDVSAGIGYRTDKFRVRLDLQCLSGFATTSVSGSVVNIGEVQAPEGDLDIKHNETKTFEEKAGLLMEYTPSGNDNFSLELKQKWNRLDPQKVVVSIHSVFFGGEPMTDYSIHIGEEVQYLTGYGASARWNHKFDKPGREMKTTLDWTLDGNEDPITWYKILGETQINSLQMTRAERHDAKHALNAAVTYRDPDLSGLKGLNLELGAGIRMDRELDRYSAENQKQGIWVDSLEYRRNFDFFALDFAPTAKLSYSPGKFKLDLRLTPDIYLRNYSGDKNEAGPELDRIRILPDFDASWTPSSKHKLQFSYRRGIVRPSYTQLCSFRRMGQYATELVEGNPDLQPNVNSKAALSYTFHSGFFTGTLEGTGRVDKDRIFYVFGRDGIFKKFNWINAERIVEGGLRLGLKAELKNFTANLGGVCNYFSGHTSSGDVIRNADWGVDGDATLKVRRGWTFNVKGRYQSKIIRPYSSTTEYVGCDFRIRKDFKKWGVYLDGKELFDKPILITTYSEDRTLARFEDYYYNRRLFSIGASFRF